MLRNGIAISRPALGGLVSSMSPSVIIVPVKANRPYIMGSAVIGTNPTPTKESTKAFVGGGQATIEGVMCLGMSQINQRDIQGFVKAGFAEDYNNMGCKGAFWCALDLSKFDNTAVDALTGNGVLAVDTNGVFSYGATAGANTTAVTGVSVLNYYDSAIIGAIDEVVAVGNTNYTFKYDKGIGAILVIIR